MRCPPTRTLPAWWAWTILSYSKRTQCPELGHKGVCDVRCSINYSLLLNMYFMYIIHVLDIEWTSLFPPYLSASQSWRRYNFPHNCFNKMILCRSPWVLSFCSCRVTSRNNLKKIGPNVQTVPNLPVKKYFSITYFNGIPIAYFWGMT